MTANPDGSRSCDGCGRQFDADTAPAELGEHRDYCGHCRLNREGDYEVERQGRRVLASALKADPALLEAPTTVSPPAESAADDEPRRRSEAKEDNA